MKDEKGAVRKSKDKSEDGNGEAVKDAGLRS